MKRYYNLCFITSALCFALFFSTKAIPATDTPSGRAFEERLKFLEPSYPENNSEEVERDILFYLYASHSAIDEFSLERQQSFFENGIEGVDLSGTSWRKESSAPFTTPYEDCISIRGYPVSKEEFKKTQNYAYKRLLNVIIRRLELKEFDFENWILIKVSFHDCDFSDCSFSNTILLGGGIFGFEDKIVQTALFNRFQGITRLPEKIETSENDKPKQMSFEQFSQTWNYKNNDFSNLVLKHMDLSDWDFADKNLSSIDIGYCVCAWDEQKERTNFERCALAYSRFDVVEHLFDIDKTIKQRLYDKKRFFPFCASSEMFVKTLSYLNKDCQNVFVDMPDLDLSSQKINFGGVVVYPSVVLSNASIQYATIQARGFDLSKKEDVEAFNSKLYSTASYKKGDMRGVDFEVPLINCDLSGQNLSGSYFSGSLKETLFDDAVITGCNFENAKDLTSEQIKSTWNYKRNKMEEITLPPPLREEFWLAR